MADCNDTLEFKNTTALVSTGTNGSTLTGANGVPLFGTNGFAYSPNIQLYQLDKIQADFEKNAFYAPVSLDIINIYGEETFNQSLISFNNFLLTANTTAYLNLPVNYPLVQDRINRGVAITPVELTMFLENAGYNPISIQPAMISNPTGVLSLYNSNIGGTFTKSTMGSFCDLAPSIFGAVAGFFTALGALAKKITDIINFIKNFSLAALLDSLKNKILGVIESTINKVKKIIENFTLDGLVNQVQQYFQQNVVAKFEIIKNKAMSFFEEFNIENFKKRVEGLISYATGIFKDLKIEEIQFLIYRFCAFISQVEGMINGIKNPLEEFSNRFVYSGKILESNSSINTLSAVASGAKRPNQGDAAAAIAAGVSAESVRGNQPPPSPEEYKDLPQWNDGKGDSRVKFQGNWVNPPGAGCEGGMGSEGWYMPNSQANLDSKVYLMRVQKAFASRTGINQIIVNSAYRSPKYNQCLSKRTTGVATNSNHMQGIAFDITWAGYPNNRNVFIEIARSFGFKGIGIYSGFTHIDRRAADYSWNG